MNLTKLIPAVAAALCLTACDIRLGHDEEDSNAGGNVSAAGKSEEGQVSVSAPGFEMKLDIPEGVRSRAGIDDDSGLIYPGAQFSGIHVQGGRGGAEGEVELRFTSADSPDAIANWYREPARSTSFSLANSGREGADFVLDGTTKEDNGHFTVRLSPRTGGGTDGRVVLADRN